MADQESRLKPWVLLVLPVTLVLVVAVLAYISGTPTEPAGRRHPIAYTDFKMLVEQGKVEEIVLRGEAVEGTLRAPAAIGRDGETGVLFSTRVPAFGDEALLPALARQHVRVGVAEVSEDWWSAFRPWLPTLFLIGLFFWIFSRRHGRSVGGWGRAAISSASSRARPARRRSRPCGSPTSPGRRTPSRRCRSSSTTCVTRRGSRSSGPRRRGASCSWPRPGRARPCSPRPWPARPGSRSSPSVARSSSRCSWAWVRHGCGTCSRRPEVTLPAGDPGSAIRMRTAEFHRVVGAQAGDFAVPEALVATGGVARPGRPRSGGGPARPRRRRG